MLYFFNTVNSFFIFAGLTSFLLLLFFTLDYDKLTLFQGIYLPLTILALFLACRIADFYPLFILMNIPALVYLVASLPLSAIMGLLLLNTAILILTQILFMGIPDSIVGRNPKIIPIKLFNSLLTVAPTTVSFTISLYFSQLLSLMLLNASQAVSSWPQVLLWMATFMAALFTFLFRPKNRHTQNLKLPITKTYFDRVIVLNIDGCRLDIFDELALPHITQLASEGTRFKYGLRTVYRALTNPAFASLMTGAAPEEHGIRDNNLGQSIKVEGLPDIVPTLLYGSMHIKHFSKKSWEVKVISLPTHSIYRSDEEMVRLLKEDLMGRPEVRLFIADFSEADFLGHAFGSTSRQYKEALKNIDEKIGSFIYWLKAQNLEENTAVIICSDHGISEIDHSYLIRKSERYVPCILWGRGIRKNLALEEVYSIRDIANTISYFMGVPYPNRAKGRVFIESLEGVDAEKTRRQFVEQLNEAFYNTISEDYVANHPEIYLGDLDFWKARLSETLGQSSGRKLRFLDFGCGAGFVGEVFQNLPHSSSKTEEFLCHDPSTAMLEQARARLKADYFHFEANWSRIEEGGEGFDVIAINSVLHHLYEPESMFAKLKILLNPGGLIIGAREPNSDFFRKSFQARSLAAAYKAIGGGKRIAEKYVTPINEYLKTHFGWATEFSEEEIFQVVEFHSPVEQYRFGIEPSRGFSASTFIDDFLEDMEVLGLETYTSFFHRGAADRKKLLKRLAARAFNTMFAQGNLIAYWARKPGGHSRRRTGEKCAD